MPSIVREPLLDAARGRLLARLRLVRVGDAMWITSFAGFDARRFDPQG